MALIGNYSVYAKTPGRLLGGTSAAKFAIVGTRSNFSTSGALRCRYVSPNGFSALSAVPSGYRPPGAWQIAIKPGAMSSTNFAIGTGALAASGAMGLNAAAAISGTGDLSVLGQLVVSAIASLSGSSTLDANLLAVLNAAATLAGSGDLAGAITALGWITSTLPGDSTVTTVPSATAEVIATITPFTDLSPESLSAAVWTTAEGAFLYAVAHNRVVTDPAAGTFTVYDTDDTTVLYVADLWADASGTTPYAGSGAERRDRLT